MKLPPFFSRKNSGQTLILTIVLSGMILAMSLSLMKLLTTEAQFSSDLLFSEKAYFAAESGVETALLELKTNPLMSWEKKKIFSTNDLADAETLLTVDNAKTSFEMSIPPRQGQKLLLQGESGHVLSSGFKEIEVVQNFTLTRPTTKIGGMEVPHLAKNLEWKIICRSTGNETVAISNVAGSDLIDQMTVGREKKSIREFFSQGVSSPCYLSLTNVGTDPLKVEITSLGGTIAPPEAEITSTGLSNGREKTILFRYGQKNLSPFFDFGLFQK